MSTVQAFYQNVPLRMLQHPGEIVPFGEWMQRQDIRSVLEIGTGPGGSAVFFHKVTAGPVLSVDLTGSAHARLREVLGPYFEGVIGDSQAEATEQAVKFHIDEVDLVFIDADHTLQAVEENYRRYGKFAAKWVAFHDINASNEWPGMGVPEFWRALKDPEAMQWVNPGPYAGPVWGGIGAVRAR